MTTKAVYRTFIISGCLAAFLGCIRRQVASLPAMEVNLYSGIEQIAKLGDDEERVNKRSQWTKKRSVDVSTEEQKEYGFTRIYFFPDTGARVFFRYGFVSLISVQEPFQGSILGKKFRVFSFQTPDGNSWEEVLVKEFGNAVSKADGGRFGSESLFYAWGDIAFNRMGPNELAIYRDPNMAKFRQKRFGRVVQFFAPPD